MSNPQQLSDRMRAAVFRTTASNEADVADWHVSALRRLDEHVLCRAQSRHQSFIVLSRSRVNKRHEHDSRPALHRHRSTGVLREDLPRVWLLRAADRARVTPTVTSTAPSSPQLRHAARADIDRLVRRLGHRATMRATTGDRSKAERSAARECSEDYSPRKGVMALATASGSSSWIASLPFASRSTRTFGNSTSASISARDFNGV
jgi:hypothetical protein